MKCFALIILLIFVPTYSQRKITQRCNLSAEYAPILQGYYLGMSLDEVKARTAVRQVQTKPEGFLEYGDLTVKDEFGARSLFLRGGGDADTVSIEFLDEHVAEIRVGYKATTVWRSPDEFTRVVAERLRLKGRWRPESRGHFLSCGGFSVRTSLLSGEGRVVIEDTAASQEQKKRKFAAEERTRKEFKP